MEKYYPPNSTANEFNCPYCNVYSHQIWSELYPINKDISFSWQQVDRRPSGRIRIAECAHCKKSSLWADDNLLIPPVSTIPQPSENMPEEVAEIYREASSVFNVSPRSSAALLRLALQKLLIHLGEDGKNINKDIASLVQKGVPAIVQQASDTIRYIGNQAVHPGEIDFEDNKDSANTLFMIINTIIHYMITQPKEIEKSFNNLPESVKSQIKQRDAN